MAELVLTAEVGRTQGTRPSRRLRKEGRIPGVVYGLGSDPVSISVDFRELRTILTTEAGLNALISLRVGESTHVSLVKEIQRHPVRNDVIHVDFLRVNPDKPLQVTVPVTLVGEPEAIEAMGGMVEQTLLSITVWAKPTGIPTEVTCDITDLEIGTAVRAESIQLPPGVTTDIDPSEVVAVGAETRSSKMAMAASRAGVSIADLAEFADGDLSVEQMLEALEASAAGGGADTGASPTE